MVYSFETFKNVKGIVVLQFLEFHIHMLFQTDFTSHQIWKIEYVNYARFPRSGHIFQWIIWI